MNSVDGYCVAAAMPGAVPYLNDYNDPTCACMKWREMEAIQINSEVKVSNAIQITDAPLSDKWRITASKKKVLDLVAIQKSLSVVAGQFSGNRLKSFRWGMDTSVDAQGNISYDVTEVLNMPAPLSGEQVDKMVGRIVHTSMRLYNESDKAVRFGMMESGNNAPLSYRQLTIVGEEVYNDGYTDRHLGTVAPEYLRRTRMQEIASQPDPEGVYNLLTAQHVYGYNVEKEKLAAFQEVERNIYYVASALFKNLRGQDMTPAQRMMSYDNAWKAIEAQINSQVQQQSIAEEMANDTFGFPSEEDGVQRPKSKAERTAENIERAKEKLGIKPQRDIQQPIDPTMGDQETDEDDAASTYRKQTRAIMAGTRQGGVRDKAMDEAQMDYHEAMQKELEKANSTESKRGSELIQAISEAIESDTEDMTEVIAGYQDRQVGESHHVSVIYQKALASDEEYTEFDVDLYRRLIWLRDLKNTLGKETIRGEESGQIDKHNLHRAGIDGRVFKKNRMKPRRDKKVVCLLDASSSMEMNKDIYKAANALQKVVKGTQVLSYREDRVAGCHIVAHTSNRGFKVVRVGGGTPSGEALLATAAKFKDHIIVHFTDGDSNYGFTTNNAADIIAKEFPKVQILDVQMRDERFPRKDDSLKNVTRIQITNVQEFPNVLQKAIEPWVKGGV